MSAAVRVGGPGGEFSRTRTLPTLLGLLVLLTAGAPLAAAATVVPPDWYVAERQALTALYMSTGGPRWTEGVADPYSPPGKKWTVSPCHCEWAGVTCQPEPSNNVTADGCTIQTVTGVTRDNRNLVGTLPAWEGALKQLTSLRLINNPHLSGSLPAAWSSAFWSDADPSPSDTDACYNYRGTTLYMYSNSLSGTLPPEYAALTTLQYLDFDNNTRISGSLPPEYSALTNLKYLWLNFNHISGSLPHEWSTLTCLGTLKLFQNSLSGTLPARWGAMTSLEQLSLENNRLSGTFPAAYSNLTKMFQLHLAHNMFTGTLPPSYSALNGTLQTFTVGKNRLSGTLPPSYASLAQLTMFTLESNLFQGTIPPSWTNYGGGGGMGGRDQSGGLQVFDARHNHLSGRIPNSLLNSSAICILLLSDNLFKELGDTGGVTSDTFFKPYCTLHTGTLAAAFVFTPFRPALLLQDNRLSCSLLGARRHSGDTRYGTAPLAACLADQKQHQFNGKNEQWDKQCRALFKDTTSANATNPAMILQGNMFDGPPPSGGGSRLVDPMWNSTPFLYFDRKSFENRVLPGFGMIVAYLSGGAVLAAFVWRTLPAVQVLRTGNEAAEETPQINRRLTRVYTLCTAWLTAYVKTR